MRKLVVVLAVAVAGITVVASDQVTTITAREARKYVGQSIVVEDTVAQVSREPQSGLTFLNFGGDFPDVVFRAVLPDDVRSRVGAAVLAASRLRVLGTPRLGALGIPEILCSEP